MLFCSCDLELREHFFLQNNEIMQHKNLLNRGHQVLENNWKGSFTIPTHNLYPFQWNWDSGFICLGHQYADVHKVIQELNALYSGQWDNGMIPHIIFHSENEKTYFPNFDFWESQVNPGASLISQIIRHHPTSGAWIYPRTDFQKSWPAYRFQGFCKNYLSQNRPLSPISLHLQRSASGGPDVHLSPLGVRA